MKTIRIILTEADPSLTHTTGDVINADTGENVSDGPVRTRLGRGTPLELDSGNYRYEFERSDDGEQTMQAIDSNGRGVAVAMPIPRDGILVGTYEFEVAS